MGISLLLLALLGLPARVFNLTGKANRHHLSAALKRAFRKVRGPGRLVPERSRALLGLAATSIVAAAGVHSFLSPGFPTRRGSGSFALGMLIGWAAIVGNTAIWWRVYLRRYQPRATARWHVYSGQLAVSALCVSVSRLAHFVPGLMLGMAGDYEPDSPVELEHRARRIAMTDASQAIISLGAWVASIPVSAAAARPTAGFAILTLDAALSVIAVAGMEILVFTLIPLTFLDGHALMNWRRRVWLALWGTGVVWFSLVVINPAISAPEGGRRASVGWLASLLALELIIAFGLWSYFVARERRRRATAL